jgi:hypothetical protein
LGQGQRRSQAAIFEDPDCPYCKVLEKTLKEVNNLTVFVFLFPIDQLHPEAAAKSRAVWCAPDRAKAWADTMHTGAVPPTPAKCADRLQRSRHLPIGIASMQHRPWCWQTVPVWSAPSRVRS